MARTLTPDAYDEALAQALAALLLATWRSRVLVDAVRHEDDTADAVTERADDLRGDGRERRADNDAA